MEEDRRLSERRPVLVGSHSHEDDVVRLVNQGPVDLDRIRWSFRVNRAAHGVIGMGTPPSTTGAVGPLAVGGEAILRVELARDGPLKGEMLLRCDCAASGEEWVITVPIIVARPGRVWGG